MAPGSAARESMLARDHDYGVREARGVGGVLGLEVREGLAKVEPVIKTRVSGDEGGGVAGDLGRQR